jgi:hypothetical protein
MPKPFRKRLRQGPTSRRFLRLSRRWRERRRALRNPLPGSWWGEPRARCLLILEHARPFCSAHRERVAITAKHANAGSGSGPVIPQARTAARPHRARLSSCTGGSAGGIDGSTSSRPSSTAARPLRRCRATSVMRGHPLPLRRDRHGRGEPLLHSRHIARRTGERRAQQDLDCAFDG